MFIKLYWYCIPSENIPHLNHFIKICPTVQVRNNEGIIYTIRIIIFIVALEGSNNFFINKLFNTNVETCNYRSHQITAFLQGNEIKCDLQFVEGCYTPEHITAYHFDRVATQIPDQKNIQN